MTYTLVETTTATTTIGRLCTTVGHCLSAPAAGLAVPCKEPRAIIDHHAFPHIIDLVLSHPDSWVAFRGTSKAYKDRVDALLYRHIVVTVAQTPSTTTSTSTLARTLSTTTTSPLLESDGPWLAVTSPLGPLPCFPPRSYAAWGSWASSPERQACAGFLSHTRIFEVSAGVRGLEWFATVLGPLDALRLRHDLGTEAAYRDSHYDDDDCDDVFDYRRFKAPKVVLLPPSPECQLLSIPMFGDVRFSRSIRKVVIHLATDSEARCIVPVLATAHSLPSVETVCILNEAAPDVYNALSRTPAARQTRDRLTNHLVALILRRRTRALHDDHSASPGVTLVASRTHRTQRTISSSSMLVLGPPQQAPQSTRAAHSASPAASPPQLPRAGAAGTTELLEHSWGRLFSSVACYTHLVDGIPVLSTEEYAARLGSGAYALEEVSV